MEALWYIRLESCNGVRGHADGGGLGESPLAGAPVFAVVVDGEVGGEIGDSLGKAGNKQMYDIVHNQTW